MIRISIGTIALLGLACVRTSSAAPVQITERQYTHGYSNEHALIETFDALAQGVQPSPLQIVNGVYVGTGSIDLAPWCDIGGSNACLDTQISDGVFEQFPLATTTWSARLYISGQETVHITVSGESGTLQTDVTSDGAPNGGTFVAFYDADGLESVSFHITEGGFNYAFDDVTTAVSSPLGTGEETALPAPTLSNGSLSLLALLTLGAGLVAAGRTLHLRR
ncbi:MAG: hypothetical protein ABIV12_14295 [Dokdonella sp.]|uniref:hypothetical protein n=1 Tax=Dokdonella sp. TaxID=2291710 RepID=UPI0032671CF0